MKFVALAPDAAPVQMTVGFESAKRCFESMGLVARESGSMPALRAFVLARVAAQGVSDRVDLVRGRLGEELEVYEFVQSSEANRRQLIDLLNSFAGLAKMAGLHGKVVWGW
jgi:hypothetical protein